MPVIKSPTNPTTVSPRIKELQMKIQDENYVNGAIERIALIVSRQIVEKHSVTGRAAEKMY